MIQGDIQGDTPSKFVVEQCAVKFWWMMKCCEYVSSVVCHCCLNLFCHWLIWALVCSMHRDDMKTTDIIVAFSIYINFPLHLHFFPCHILHWRHRLGPTYSCCTGGCKWGWVPRHSGRPWFRWSSDWWWTIWWSASPLKLQHNSKLKSQHNRPGSQPCVWSFKLVECFNNFILSISLVTFAFPVEIGNESLLLFPGTGKSIWNGGISRCSHTDPCPRTGQPTIPQTYCWF